MTNTRQRQSRLHLVALTTLTLLVACDQSDPNAVEPLTEIESDPNTVQPIAQIESDPNAVEPLSDIKHYPNPLAHLPNIDPQHDPDDIKSLHSTRERTHQLRLQAKYRRCLTEQSPCDSINTRLAYHDETFSTREHPRIITVTIIPLLPDGITHQQFFDVGEGCESDDPTNQWTTAETVTIRYTGPWQHNYAPTWGKCEIALRMKTADAEITPWTSFKEPYQLMFKVAPPLIGQPLPVL